VTGWPPRRPRWTALRGNGRGADGERPITGEERPVAHDEYAVRRYHEGDANAIVALHNDVWGGDRSVAWFRWKYLDNPAADEVTVSVVTHDGELVGIAGLVPVRMRVDGEEGLGALAGDLVVHPDHRRRGVFTRLFGSLFGRSVDDVTVASDQAIDTDGPGFIPDLPDVDFLFAYATPQSHSGIRQLGWTDLEPRRRFVRVHDPTSFLRDRLGARAARVLGPLARAGARAWLAWRDSPETVPADVTVSVSDSVPVGELDELAGRGDPAGISPVYDREFYEWRYAAAPWTHDGTYLARRDGDLLAGVIVRKTSIDRLDATTVSLVHTVPLAGERRIAGIRAIVDRILTDHAEASFLRAWNPVFPEDLLRERGFRCDDRPPLSWTSGPDLQLVARTVSGAPFSTEALRASAPALWSLDT